jgi:DNA-directed RNA polymerase alpha subunit
VFESQSGTKKNNQKGIESMTMSKKYEINIYNKPIEELKMSERAYNGLKIDNVECVGDLIQLKKAEILRIPNIGNKSLQEMINALDLLSLKIGTEPIETKRTPKEYEIRNIIDSIREELNLIERKLHGI